MRSSSRQQSMHGPPMSLALLLLAGLCGCDSDSGSGSSGSPGPSPLTLEVEISAPSTVYVGEEFQATATSTGTLLTYDWIRPANAVIDDEAAQSPKITMCQHGDFELHVGVSGAVIPGVPGTGSALKVIHVLPPADLTIADSEFALSDWELVLDYDCAEPIPDTLEYNAFHVDDGGYSGPYRRLSEFLLWPGNPGSLIMDYDHWYTGQTYDPAAQGPVAYLRFLFQARLIGDYQVEFIPVIRQGGRIFLISSSETIQPEQEDWVAMDFRELWDLQFHEDCAGGGDLDLTTNGAPMEFGVRLRHYTYDITDQAELLVTCIDDFEVEIASPWSINECVDAAQPEDACPNDPDKTAPGACGCGVADDDTDGDGIPDCLGGCPDISGTWTVDVTGVTSSCGDEGDWFSTFTVTQEGCSVIATGIKEPGRETSGLIVGDIVTIGPDQYTERDGGTTTSTFTFTVTSDTTMSGQESWSWRDSSGNTCTGGTSQLAATKVQ